MARGGQRDNAGRPKTVQDKDYTGPEIKDLEKLTPLEYFKATLKDPSAPHTVRYKAAQDAAPYMHAKLAPKAETEDQGTLDDTWGTMLPPKARELKQGLN